MPKSLGGRLTLACAGFALLTCLIGLLMYEIVHEEIEKHLDRRSHAEAQALLAAAQPRGLAGVIEAVRSREATHSAGDLGYIVVDARGRRVAGTLDAATPRTGYTEFVHYRLAGGGGGIAQAYNTAIPGGGNLIVATDRSDIDHMDHLIFGIFGMTTAIIVLVGIGATVALRRMINRRLTIMGTTAEAIMAGDLSRRMPLLRDAEFDQISHVINRMLERIEALLKNLGQLSTDLAHDIRSPLNRVRNSLEQVGGLEGNEDGAAAAIAEIDDLLDLLNGLLGISEIEGFTVRKRFIELDLAEVAADMVDGYRPAVEAAGLDLTFESDTARVRGDPALLRRALANLIDNALLHAGGATRLDIRVTAAGATSSIIVSDNGIGVEPQAQEAIFHRFVRLDASRSTPGHGLGLNMVSAIAKAHHGEARAKPSAVGLAVEILIPLAPASGAVN